MQWTLDGFRGGRDHRDLMLNMGRACCLAHFRRKPVRHRGLVESGREARLGPMGMTVEDASPDSWTNLLDSRRSLQIQPERCLLR